MREMKRWKCTTQKIKEDYFMLLFKAIILHLMGEKKTYNFTMQRQNKKRSQGWAHLEEATNQQQTWQQWVTTKSNKKHKHISSQRWITIDNADQGSWNLTLTKSNIWGQVRSMETHGEESVVEQLVRNVSMELFGGWVKRVVWNNSLGMWHGNSMARRKRQVVGGTTCKRPIAPIVALIMHKIY